MLPIMRLETGQFFAFLAELGNAMGCTLVLYVVVVQFRLVPHLYVVPASAYTARLVGISLGATAVARSLHGEHVHGRL